MVKPKSGRLRVLRFHKMEVPAQRPPFIQRAQDVISADKSRRVLDRFHHEPAGGRRMGSTGHFQGTDMAIRLGEVLVEQGVLTRDQVEAVLEQQQLAAKPFGLLAELLFDVSQEQIERAWAEQYRQLAPTCQLDDNLFSESAIGIVNRRQAWQFRILPVRHEGSELVIATTVEHLAKALKFVSRRLPVPCQFIIVDAKTLGRWLCARYPMPGMSEQSVLGDPFEGILAAS
jgi:ribosomal protein L16/L10AE